MPKFPFGPFVSGLSTLVDNAGGDPSASPDAQDVRGFRGLLTTRKGFRVLDIEPSGTPHSGLKSFGYLTFDGVNDYASNTAWTQTMGLKWTVRLWAAAVSLSTVNQTNGTRTLLHIKGTTYDPLLLQIVGLTSGSTAQLKATIKDLGGTVLTLTGTARTTTAWVTLLGNHAAAQIRLVRDGSTVTMYIGEQVEATGTLSSVAHEPGTEIWLGASAGPAAGTYVYMQLIGLTIINRALTEYETYWNIGYPTDSDPELDILANYTLSDATGTTVTDYSSYQDHLTVSGAAWSGTNIIFPYARGLGIFSWRRANGDIYYALASTRRGSSSANAAPSGAIYTWKASQTFLPFYFGGDPANDDATAGLSGLDPFARVCFVQGRDMLLLSNGKDFCRKYMTSFQYMGGTAPPLAPILSLSSAGGAFKYAYSYWNPVTGTETGLSPIGEASGNNGTIQWFLSSDTQFTHVRIYRTKTGETSFYLHSEQTMAAPTVTDAISDTVLASGPFAPGTDLSGNRQRKRAYLAFPTQFVRNDPPISMTAGRAASAGAITPQKGPGVAPTVGSSAGGSLSAGDYYTAYSFYDPTNDVETGMSPATKRTAAANDKLDITGMVTPPEAVRFTQMRIYRTKKDAYTLYLDQTITAAATATSSQADSALSTTIETRALPPRAEFMCVFANRLWMAYGTTLAWSTVGYLEDIPESNALSPKAGVRITGISPTEGALFVHFEDGTIHMLPHPGDEDDLIFFVPTNLRQWAPRGATVGHYTVQPVPGGLVWLSKDGFVFANPQVLMNASPQISPDFLNLNGSRGRYAVSMYDGSRGMYRCWVSRGNNRLNEECFVGFRDQGQGWGAAKWWLDNLHADAAGVLFDAKSNPHYCFMVENGVLFELDETLDYDGDGSGTLSGTVATPFIGSFADIVGRTAPTGGDGGYPINLLKSDGTFARRFALDPGMDPRGDVDNYQLFYPSYSSLSTSYTAYYHGIRGYWKTMQLYLASAFSLKSLRKILFAHGKESAGGLQVNLSADDGTLTAANQDGDLTKNGVSQITVANGSFRKCQVEFYSDPPAASRPWKVLGIQMDAEVQESDAGT